MKTALGVHLGGVVFCFFGLSTFTWQSEASEVDLTDQALKARFQNSVVKIVVEEANGGPATCADVGTGFLLSQDGYIVTAAHVVPSKEACQGKHTISGRFPWKFDVPIRLEIVEKIQPDALLLKVNDDEWDNIKKTACTLNVTFDEIGEDQPIFRFGYSFSDEKRSTPLGFLGTIITTVANSPRPPLQSISSMINHGHSGGPVLGLKSQSVVGITEFRRDSDPAGNAVYGEGYIIPIAILKSWFDKFYRTDQLCPERPIVESVDFDLRGFVFERAIQHVFRKSDKIVEGKYLELVPPAGLRVTEVISGTFYSVTEIVGKRSKEIPIVAANNCREIGLCAEVREGKAFIDVSGLIGKSNTTDVIGEITVVTKQLLGAETPEFREALAANRELLATQLGITEDAFDRAITGIKDAETTLKNIEKMQRQIQSPFKQ